MTTPSKLSKKSILTTPDPYHTPRYGGFCPQFKYQIGETFGRTTSRLLRDTNVASSGNLVLADIDPKLNKQFAVRDNQIGSIRERKQSWGDQKLINRMVPGYTGFIPKSQHYFGSRYAEICMKSISDFEGDQQQYQRNIDDMQVMDALQTERLQPNNNLTKLISRHQAPFRPITEEYQAYISKNNPQQTVSPFQLSNNNPDRHFMSGYTGFVPLARGLQGAGYPNITHDAMNEFTDQLQRRKQLQNQPIQIKRTEKVRIDTKPIFPIHSGLVPHYTGHIPGERYRFGNTFGHSTQNAKNISPVAASM